MNFRQLRYFASIVEEGSFSAAARKCGLAQPSLSQQIQNLEEELGESLLRRGARGVSVTEAGALVYERAQRIQAEQQSLLDSFRERGSLRIGEVSFGVIPTIAPSLLPDLLSRFLEAHGEVVVNVRESQTSRLIRMVVDEDVEFAVVSDIDAASRKRWSLQVNCIYREPILLAVPDRHAMAGRGRAVEVAKIDPAEIFSLTEGHCLRDQTPALCRPKDLLQRTHCEQLPTLLALVRAGLGIAFVPEMFVRDNATPGVRFLKLRNPEPFREINIMKRRGRVLSPVANQLLKLINEG